MRQPEATTRDGTYGAASPTGHTPAFEGHASRLDPHAVLLEIGNLLATKLEPEVLFDTTAQVLRAFFGIDRASLVLYDPDRDAFEVIALALHEGSSLGKGFSLPRVGSRAGKVFDSRKPYYSRLGPGGFFEDVPLAREGMQTSLLIPMIVEGRPVGTFNVDTRRNAGINEFDLDLLTKLANQIGGAAVNARAFQTMRRENANLLRLIQAPDPCCDLIANCQSLRGSIDRLMKLAKVDATVLITGETGTGKDVLARTLHGWSARRKRPFVKCDCAVLTPTLVESELFGHEKGAFTGAHARHIGWFELAHGGTLFLDEVAEIPLEAQAKLLGVLEDREFQRVGGTDTISVDIRIIAATNRDLRTQVAAGKFRQDLFYRLNVLSVHLPPLRERAEDIRPLAEHFIGVYNRALGYNVSSLSPSALAALESHPWPGNVRELQNVIERAILLSEGPALTIGRDVLAPDPTPLRDVARHPSSQMTLAEVETRHILQILNDTKGRVAGPRGAAKILGLHPNTLRSLMERLGIERERIARERLKAAAEP